ncbi:hypothetical protein FSARC_320 [Fusarium sarcochroum]|uniref:Ankyrin repeat protein n=1 Tax=Fusarium sarcochroum TaxID=1208366 RepID=A0A8H4UBH5_9HYPO|nr:hypothetical protein FSARC_320 [Fusarium sarcochroum]
MTDSNRTHPDIDSGYGESSNQSLKTNDGSSNQQPSLDDVSAVSEACPQPLPPSASGSNQAQRTAIRPISKPMDEQTAKRASDVIEQMSGLLQEDMAKPRRRNYLSRSRRAFPSMSIRAIMLGTTTEDAKVCLVIFCDDTDGTHDRIRRFLRKSLVGDLFRPVDNTIPSFDVHIVAASPNTRAEFEVRIMIEGRFSDPSISTLCGMPVYLLPEDHPVQQPWATMGGILQIEMPLESPSSKRLYGLTVAHGASDPRYHHDDFALYPNDSSNEYYGSLTGSTKSDGSHHTSAIEIDWGDSIKAIPDEPRPFIPVSRNLSNPKQPIVLSAMRNSESFRDWALFEFPTDKLVPKPNMLQVEGRLPVLLKAPASLVNLSSSRSVSIITGSSGVKEATLSPCISRVLLQPGTEFVRAYSVELSENSGKTVQKTLDSLLDKVPQWLQPRTVEEMNTRLQKLAQSPLRNTQARRHVDSALLLLATVKSASEADADSLDNAEIEVAESFRGSWPRNKDAPSISSPAPIPGDFLRLDELPVTQGYCGPGLLPHDSRYCLCYVRDETSLEDFVTEKGPTPKASDLPDLLNISPPTIDSFGNTALHFLAARHNPASLLKVVTVASDLALSTLNIAHQTFLHVLGAQWFVDVGTERLMLPTLLNRLKQREFPIYAQDVYGRSFFHILQTNVRNQETIDHFLSQYDRQRFSCRDAFGVIPTRSISSETMPLVYPQTGSDHSQMATHARILENIRLAREGLFFEDSHGRNGLHLTADAIIASNTKRPSLPLKATAKFLKHARNEDSLKTQLLSRNDLVEGLLTAGVDVNHYSKDGNTVLMAFVARLPEGDDYKTQCEIIQQLIDSGAGNDARNGLGERALHIAVRTGRKLAMRTLVKAGANVHVRDGEGRSVLDVADVKILHAKDVKKYAHYEAIRAWLSGSTANAVQSPSVKQEWGRKTVI